MMEDKKIDDLLNGYSRSLGHSRHITATARAKPFPLWKPVMVTALGATMIGAFVLMPRRAEAAPIEKVLQALNGTKFWMASTTTRTGNGKWGHYSTSIIQDGRLWFKSEIFGGAPRQVTTLVDHEFEYNEWSELPYVLKSRFVLDPRTNMSMVVDPLKSAFSHVGGIRSDFVRKNGIQFNGKQAYTLSLASKRTKAKSGNLKDFELIVESSTDLPMVATIRYDVPGTNSHQEIKTIYDYDESHNRQPLIPNPKKTLIDADVEKKRWVDKWTPMIEGASKPKIVESTISPDGTIWIAFVSDSDQNNHVYPKLDDKEYISGVTYSLSNWKSVAAPRVKGKDVLVSAFLALNPKSSQKTSVKLRWNLPANGQETQPITCQLTSENWDFPSYFPPFMNDINIDHQKLSMWRMRGDAYRSRKMLKEAASAYMKSYEILRRNHYFVNSNQNPLEAAAECYERLGDKKTASKLRKMIPTGPHPRF